MAVRRYAWLAFLLAGAAGSVALFAIESLGVRTALILVILGAGFLATVAGIVLHRPRPAVGWWLLAAVTGIWFVGWIGWQTYIYDHGGVTPPLDSWRNAIYLTLYVSMIAAAFFILRRLDRAGGAVVDAAILAAAIGTVAWEVLILHYVEDPDVRGSVKAVQIAVALGDVALVAVLLRIASSRVRWCASTVLVLMSVAAYLASNVLWNWSAQLGSYLPGSWADLGWYLFPVGIGAAALHPSMRTLFERQERQTRELGVSQVGLLVAAVLVGPLVVAVHALEKNDLERDGFLAGASAAIGLLVLARLVRNVRERQKLNARLEERNRELQELDRLKDDFVASVSHELRTPLTSIRGYLELVLEGEAGELTEQQETFLGIVDRNAERLLRVIGDLLFVAQLNAGALPLERGSVDLSQLARDAAESARPVAEQRGIELSLELGALPESITGDSSRLAQALDNLVSNAIKFTPSGGSVALRAGTVDGRVELAVADTGPGISEEDQARLFQRFFRTADASEKAVPGTGLGLAITKAIVEAHGGSIRVDSELGRGTEFLIELPVAA